MSTPPLGWLSKDAAGVLIGRSGDFVSREIIPRMPPGTKRRGTGRGHPWSLLATAVVRAFAEDIAERLAGDPAEFSGSDSPWLERRRRAQALAAEDALGLSRGQLIRTDLFEEAMRRAFTPIRRFATDVILHHGNGAADAWREAVDLFEKEIEHVVGKSCDCDGAGGDEAVGGITDSGLRGTGANGSRTGGREGEA